MGKNSSGPIGLYIHVPFCRSKCPYCDFFSLCGAENLMDDYTGCIINQINFFSEKIRRSADTLYFGGGTPSLLGGRRIARITEAARRAFGLNGAEITVEANPGGELSGFMEEVHAAGVNRISLGLQSANVEELRLLGRSHTPGDAKYAVQSARKAGIENISLDLMLAVQGQNKASLINSMDFCAGLGVPHISAYLLTLEPRTVYWKSRKSLRLPDEEASAELYLTACNELEKRGYHQYEISNFAKPGFESSHNLKYWHCQEYLGLGPSAHSYINGKRFHFESNLQKFLHGSAPVQDGEGGSFDEFAMLRLRLAEGLTDSACRERFGVPIPGRIRRAAKVYESCGLTSCWSGGFRFTPHGFLLSNTLTAEILFASP